MNDNGFSFSNFLVLYAAFCHTLGTVIRRQAVGHSLVKGGAIAIVEKLFRLCVCTAFMLYILTIYAK